ncbi:MAG: hypothetical protein COX49_09010 [bacterium (Candidatus Stahlbacteria) CG23_combo_of_CG06-09_8_20_14_all_40_9]|nr:MAG: hypothetical protein COX49_09010 [bacterium (Candidatus Stahlbacteria) CG23_combo_of_CG06-09_8_20_14_all_40_9]
MMPEHCLFCDNVVVYTNGFPEQNIMFGLCESHAYRNYRTKSGKPRKKPQFNLTFTRKAWDWAREKAALQETSVN